MPVGSKNFDSMSYQYLAKGIGTADNRGFCGHASGAKQPGMRAHRVTQLAYHSVDIMGRLRNMHDVHPKCSAVLCGAGVAGRD